HHIQRAGPLGFYSRRSVGQIVLEELSDYSAPLDVGRLFAGGLARGQRADQPDRRAWGPCGASHDRGFAVCPRPENGWRVVPAASALINPIGGPGALVAPPMTVASPFAAIRIMVGGWTRCQKNRSASTNAIPLAVIPNHSMRFEYALSAPSCS